MSMRIVYNFLALILIVILFYTISFALSIGYYDNYPLIYEHNGQPKGLFIDVLERADILRNQKVEFVYGEFSDLMERLKNGEINLLVAVAHTPEREELYTFNSEPVIMNWGVLVSLKSIENFMLLDSKVIAVNKGDVYYQRFKDLAKSFGISLDYIEKDTYEEVIQAVDSGETVAGVVSRLAYIVNSAKYPKVLATSFIFSPVALKFAMKKGEDTSVLDNIDKTLALMKANGELDKLFNEYFGLSKQKQEMSVGIFLLIILSVVYLLTILAFKHLLKREKYRCEAALEGYKRTLILKDIPDETRNVYNYTFGQEILKNYIALSKRENHALCVVVLEFEDANFEEKRIKVENVFKQLLKDGDFVFTLNEHIYVFVLYQYGIFFIEVFRKKFIDLLRREEVNTKFYIGAKQFDFSENITADILIYEAVAEMEKDKQFRKMKE